MSTNGEADETQGLLGAHHHQQPGLVQDGYMAKPSALASALAGVGEELGAVGTVQVLEARGVSLALTTFSMTVSLMGAGILGLPYVFLLVGLVLAPCVVLAVGLFSALTSYLQVHAVHDAGVATVEELAEKVGGKAAKVVMQLTVVALLFGGLVSYTIIVAELLAPVWTYYLPMVAILQHQAFVVATISGVLILPFTCLRSLARLKYSGTMSAVLITYLVVFLIATGISRLTNDEPIPDSNPIEYVIISNNIFRAVPICFFIFTIQPLLGSFQRELHNPTPGRMTIASSVAITCCFVVYSTSSAFAYIAFRDDTCDNIMSSFNVSNVGASIARVGLGITLSLVYSFVFFPMRLTILSMCGYSNKPGEEAPLFVWCAIAVVSVAAISVTAVIVPNVNTAFGFTGAVACTLLCFTYPQLLYMRAKPRPWYVSAGCVILALVAVAVGSLSVMALIDELLHPTVVTGT